MKLHSVSICLVLCLAVAYSLSCEQSQPSVITGSTDHAVYFWATVKSTADYKALAKVAANLAAFTDQVSPPGTSSPAERILAGVGFGHNFYNKVSKKQRQFSYVTRKGVHGTMPASDGDIFVHAKSNTKSKLFELVQKLLRELGRRNLQTFEDVYGFVYKDGRDLSGFIDGTENPQQPELRREVAVDCSDGGSFVLTQRWVHDMEYIERMADKALEDVIGRTKEQSIELDPLPPTSHVASMLGSPDKSVETPFQLVRQSMPYGTLSGDAGLFFISYSNSTKNVDFMLDNMIGKGDGKVDDKVMTISRAVSGNYWFFPGVKELAEIKA